MISRLWICKSTWSRCWAQAYTGSNRVLTAVSGTQTKRHILLPTTAANVTAHLPPPTQSSPAAAIPATKSATHTPRYLGLSVVERESNNASGNTTPNISTNNVRKDAVLRAAFASTRLSVTFTSRPEIVLERQPTRSRSRKLLQRRVRAYLHPQGSPASLRPPA